MPIAERSPLEIVHSPLSRAAQTAAACAEKLETKSGSRPPLIPDPGFAELAQGSWEGRTREDIERRDGELLAAWRHDPLRANAPGGERVLDAAGRVHDALVGVVDRLAAEVATDSAVSSAATSVTLGGGTTEGGGTAGGGGAIGGSWNRVPGYPGAAPADARWTLIVGHDGIFKVTLLTLLGLSLDAFWTFPFALCGLSVVEVRESRGRLRAHNLVDHLAPLAEEEHAEAEAASREATGAL